MEELILLHNPKAGEEDHDREMLVNMMEEAGFSCRYMSLKEKRWKKFGKDIELLVVAGGDGSIRKVAKHLLNRRLLDKPYKILIFPMGTANNIAKSLRIGKDWLSQLRQYSTGKIKEIDVGTVHNVSEGQFFLEGMGYGLLPRLMAKMDALNGIVFRNKEEELQFAMRMLLNITKQAKAKQISITIDHHKTLEGAYLLVEIMNFPMVGPNLKLAPQANPADGKLNLVLLKADRRAAFISFIEASLANKPVLSPCQVLSGRHFDIKSEGTLLHLDDELIDTKRPRKIGVEARKRVLEFLLFP